VRARGLSHLSSALAPWADRTRNAHAGRADTEQVDVTELIMARWDPLGAQAVAVRTSGVQGGARPYDRPTPFGQQRPEWADVRYSTRQPTSPIGLTSAHDADGMWAMVTSCRDA
jgi:hypothetical protein